MSSPSAQLDAIQSMLAKGQRNVRIERHSLIYWGLAAGFLVVALEWFVTKERFPELWSRAVFTLVSLTVVLGLVAVLDFRKTRRLRAERGETLPFTHRQIMRIWWVLMGLGVSLTFAMFFYGGGFMLYSIWLVLFGLALYIHGLFSEQMLEWAGVLIILLGIAASIIALPYDLSRWLAASVFGIGLPALSFNLDQGRSRPFAVRAMQSGLWLLLVLTPVLIAFLLTRNGTLLAPPQGTGIGAEEYQKLADRSGLYIVHFALKSQVDVEMKIQGQTLETDDRSRFQARLRQPVDVVFVDGKAEGRYRIGAGSWRDTRNRGSKVLRIPKLDTTLTLDPATGPVITADFLAVIKE